MLRIVVHELQNKTKIRIFSRIPDFTEFYIFSAHLQKTKLHKNLLRNVGDKRPYSGTQ